METILEPISTVIEKHTNKELPEICLAQKEFYSSGETAALSFRKEQLKKTTSVNCR